MKFLPKQLRCEERVLLFDPEVHYLSLVALSRLDSSFIPLQGNRFAEALQELLTCLAAQYTVLEIPKFHPQVDIYGFDEPDTTKTYTVVTRFKQVEEGMNYISRLSFYRISWGRAGGWLEQSIGDCGWGRYRRQR